MSKFARITHWATVGLIGAAVLAATGVGFAQSWAGLYGWALEHRLHGWKAMSFPAMVDLFIAIGELGLFKIAIEGHQLRKALLPWVDLLLPLLIAIAGWSASLAFNVGHVGGSVNDKLTAGVPPVASMLGLFVLLRTLHRIVAQASTEIDPAGLPEPLPESAATEGRDEAASDSDVDTDSSDGTAGPEVVTDLPTAVRTALNNGAQKKDLMREFRLSRYKLDKILDQQEREPDSDTVDTEVPVEMRELVGVLIGTGPAAINGHDLSAERQAS